MFFSSSSSSRFSSRATKCAKCLLPVSVKRPRIPYLRHRNQGQLLHSGHRGSVSAGASTASAFPNPEDNNSKSRDSNKLVTRLVFTVAFATMAAATAAVVTSGQASTFKDILVNGPLGRSGFLAAFSLIFLSEIGDKTFFIAALLAMKLGRWVSFVGSLGALGIMTVISVAIGAIFSKLPDSMQSSLPIGEIAGIALLVFFGVRALKDAYKSEAASDDEMADAEIAVKQAESSGRVGKRSVMSSLLEVGTLIFLAEWGDRSMLATIALGAAQNPVGVAVGAVAGHAIATAIAVVGGALAAKYVSEKTVNLMSGILFLVFAAATAYSMV